MNYNSLITPNSCIHIQSSTLLLLHTSDISNCNDVDVTFGCYQRDYSSWDNVELWILIYSLGVIMVITVHVISPFLRPFLLGANFFVHTCI